MAANWLVGVMQDKHACWSVLFVVIRLHVLAGKLSVQCATETMISQIILIHDVNVQ